MANRANWSPYDGNYRTVPPPSRTGTMTHAEFALLEFC